MFVDYSSAFNILKHLNPFKALYQEKKDPGLNPLLCQLSFNFLSDRPQALRVEIHVSPAIFLSTKTHPQLCSELPAVLCVGYYCVAWSDTTAVIKFDDDTVLVSLIFNNNEKVRKLENWCQENNRLLSVSKTIELIVDFCTN